MSHETTQTQEVEIDFTEAAINAAGRHVRYALGDIVSLPTTEVSDSLSTHVQDRINIMRWRVSPMKKLNVVISASAVALVSFFGMSAALAATDSTSLADLAKPVFDAVMAGHYSYAVALALVLAVTALRKYGAQHWKFLATDAGGALMVLATSFTGAMATALASGGSVSFGLLWTACTVAAGAAGGYSLIRRLVVPLLEKLNSKLPAALQKPINAVLWFFEGPNTASAVAAGNAAVAANPAPGVTAITGTPTDAK